MSGLITPPANTPELKPEITPEIKQGPWDSFKKMVQKHLGELVTQILEAHGELTLETSASGIQEVLFTLRDVLHFEQLTDLFGVDYSTYGQAEWKTDKATGTGFSRACNRPNLSELPSSHRFAVIYQLLSLKHNLRVRVRVFLDADDPRVPSAYPIYNIADWLEREAFDLFGILFENHPDLRRILTDYGFSGYPFRKDFPISGHVEMRYDQHEKRVVYGPVEIEPRVLVPRVIRADSRYGYADQNLEKLNLKEVLKEGLKNV